MSKKPPPGIKWCLCGSGIPDSIDLCGSCLHLEGEMAHNWMLTVRMFARMQAERSVKGDVKKLDLFRPGGP